MTIRNRTVTITFLLFNIESISLDDLQEELRDITNWFHMGVLLKISTSKLLSILFNYKQIGSHES